MKLVVTINEEIKGYNTFVVELNDNLELKRKNGHWSIEEVEDFDIWSLNYEFDDDSRISFGFDLENGKRTLNKTYSCFEVDGYVEDSFPFNFRIID